VVRSSRILPWAPLAIIGAVISFVYSGYLSGEANLGFEPGPFVIGAMIGSGAAVGLASPVFAVVGIARLVRRGSAQNAESLEPRCSACGYSAVGLAGTACPECGASPPVLAKAPRRRQILRWLVLASLVGGVGGSACAAAWLLFDYTLFCREASAYYGSGKSGQFMRKRAWPCSNSSFVQEGPGKTVFNTG